MSEHGALQRMARGKHDTRSCSCAYNRENIVDETTSDTWVVVSLKSSLSRERSGSGLRLCGKEETGRGQAVLVGFSPPVREGGSAGS